jgi:glucosamine--fructose-6-phosphate aminotransferase (isomerizing)
MCGIVGYVGKDKVVEILLNGLKNLEYRGYDSSGIALQGKTSQIIKSVGHISSLEEKIKKTKLIDCNMGIAHTRWATNGEPNLVNAHPQVSGKVTLVHNGIIENSKDLKEELSKEGISFTSDTDTEVVAALINKYLDDKDVVKSINKALSYVKGSYALGIIIEGIDKIYATRCDSPLIVGLSKTGNFIASDIAAIIDYTKDYFLLEKGEIAVLDSNNVDVYKDNKLVTKKVLVANIDASSKEKNGFPHFMLKEIMEEPIVLKNTLKPYLDNLDNLEDLTAYEEIHIVACGSAMYAGMIGKTLLEEYGNTKASVECASEYRYRNIIYDKKTLVILISQSGETADTIAAMRKAKDSKIDTLAIVNVKTSTIAREADKVIFIEAGPEIAVATTKAYILQVAILTLLAYKVALKKNLVKDKDKVIKELSKLPRLIKEVLDRRDSFKSVAQELYKHEDIFFIGRQIDYATSLEGSLKLKEVSYIHSEAYQAGELKHGTISLIEEGMPVIAIMTDDKIMDKTYSNVLECAARGAKIIIISNKNIDSPYFNVVVPKISCYFQPLLVVPVLQLVAYEVALSRGCDIDKPKNLAKSVTVE